MNTLTEDQNILKVVKEYFNPAKVLNIKRFGSGHINDTYIVEFKEIKYILQKINDYVFQSPIGVMYNVELITEYIRNRVIYEGENYGLYDYNFPLNTFNKVA